jgi:hypothetical protein
MKINVLINIFVALVCAFGGILAGVWNKHVLVEQMPFLDPGTTMETELVLPEPEGGQEASAENESMRNEQVKLEMDLAVLNETIAQRTGELNEVTANLERRKAALAEAQEADFLQGNTFFVDGREYEIVRVSKEYAVEARVAMGVLEDRPNYRVIMLKP